MTTLDDFAPGATPTRKRKAKPEWHPPTVADLAIGRVLAFDPSLSSTGFADLECDGDHLIVHAGETFTGAFEDGLTGWAKDFAAAESLRQQFTELLRRYLTIPGLVIVHEAPPMGGGRRVSPESGMRAPVMSPESAVQASLMLRTAALDLQLPMRPMVRPQDHKRMTVNQANAKKQAYHKLLRLLLETLSPGSTKIITNESQRDAAGVALADMIRRRPV